MSMKKWLIALGIVGLLAIAYFRGGDSPQRAKPPASSDAAALQAVSAAGGAGAQASGQPQASDGAPLAAEGELAQGVASPLGGTQPGATPQPGAAPAPASQQPASPTGADKAAPSAAAATAATAPAKQAVPPAPASAAPTAVQPPASPDAGQPAATAKPLEGGKDKYQTEPVPSGKPQPVEWQDVKVQKDKKLTATLSVVSTTILDHMDKFNKDKREVLPADGVIYKARQVTFYEGESVFDVLLREMKSSKIHMEFSMTPMYNSNYIEGINNIYEFDCGELSGWMYKVNGWFPNYGSSRYMLKDGDVIEWVYTCDLGRDVGAEQSGGNRS
ncbi:DUF4430 domain-containing protein [Paenibacillus aestuarii]|uniref:DUF4430 domain-containing protein n=1 Tax=Paenibacillus aestuarii TaxID=516965 RepID=A0ABW0K7L0_9BACL|nr:DUF4430 domain-containing protein [Paenibacillus aestuarii]